MSADLIRRQEEIEAMEGRWKYVQGLEKEIKELKETVAAFSRANTEISERNQKLQEENMMLSSKDNVDEYNYGAHMMAKQILKEFKHNSHGGFGEELANEVVKMYHTLRKAAVEASSLCKLLRISADEDARVIYEINSILQRALKI